MNKDQGIGAVILVASVAGIVLYKKHGKKAHDL
jgi:hypothetical protein